MVSADRERDWTAQRAPLWDELSVLVAEARRDQRRMPIERVDLLAPRAQRAGAARGRLRARQPSSPLVPRLNDLVAAATAAVRVRRPARLRTVAAFLATGYPRLVWQVRSWVALCAGIGLTVTVASFLWAVSDPVTAATYLPPSVRDAAYFRHDAIPAGLMAPEAAGIFTNNILVSLYALGGGLTLGILTLYVTWSNAMLLGVLSGVVNRDGVDSEYWSLILPHGVLELSAFAIAGGAGLSIADAIIRARPEPRSVAVRRAGRDAVLIGVGTMPLLVIAGTIEGFITPSSLPIPVKLAVAPLTGVLLALYLLRGRSHGPDAEQPTGVH